MVSAVKRWQPSHHLEQNCSQAVVVYSVAVWLSIQHLWGHVLSATTVRFIESVFFSYLRKTEISQFYVAVYVNEDVLGLEVSIKNVLAVDVL